MADGDKEYIGGWLTVEDWRLPWDGGVVESDVRIVVTGETGHVRWQLFRVAWREACHRDLELLLQSFADRVGIKYSPTHRRREAPHNDGNDDTGGNP